MPDRQWFISREGQQYGPFSDERLRQLIAERNVTADSFVWCEGMKDWVQAGDVPGLIPTTRSPLPPTGAATPAAGAAQPLATTVGVWPLFGRLLLLVLSVYAVIPLPWVAISFLRWFVDHIELPGQQRASFVGKFEDIWYVFIGYALCGLASIAAYFVARDAVGLPLLATPVQWLFIPLTAFLALIITRWFYANLVWPGQSAPLRFTGEYWALLGWMLLSTVSIFSIIGWAWVFTAWGRWMCRNVTGAHRELVFTASGLGILWRTLLFTLSFAVLVPIPWTLRWYTRWMVSQFALRN
jgi:GYF domain 2